MQRSTACPTASASVLNFSFAKSFFRRTSPRASALVVPASVNFWRRPLAACGVPSRNDGPYSCSRTNKSSDALTMGTERQQSMTKSNGKSNTAVKQLMATDLEIQHAYVEQISKQGERGYALIAANTFVQGMRDSGYKSTATAVDEFGDNAYQSGANRIDIVYST